MNFLTALLTNTPQQPENGGGWLTYVIMGVAVVLMIVFFVISSRNNKKKQEEQEAIMNAIRPGNKVKTIGGVCGIIVEVDNEENTFVLETGNELNGKSYIKFDKQAIYQTDAKVETSEGKTSDKAEEKPEETPKAEETATETVVAEEKSAETTAVTEEAVAEAPKKRTRRSSKKKED